MAQRNRFKPESDDWLNIGRKAHSRKERDKLQEYRRSLRKALVKAAGSHKRWTQLISRGSKRVPRELLMGVKFPRSLS